LDRGPALSSDRERVFQKENVFSLTRRFAENLGDAAADCFDGGVRVRVFAGRGGHRRGVSFSLDRTAFGDAHVLHPPAHRYLQGSDVSGYSGQRSVLRNRRGERPQRWSRLEAIHKDPAAAKAKVKSIMALVEQRQRRMVDAVRAAATGQV